MLWRDKCKRWITLRHKCPPEKPPTPKQAASGQSS